MTLCHYTTSIYTRPQRSTPHSSFHVSMSPNFPHHSRRKHTLFLFPLERRSRRKTKSVGIQVAFQTAEICISVAEHRGSPKEGESGSHKEWGWGLNGSEQSSSSDRRDEAILAPGSLASIHHGAYRPQGKASAINRRTERPLV